MERYIVKKEGYTLIEITVSMAIFITVMTMVIGFFVSLYRLQGQYRQAANLQQEGRIVTEFFTRNMKEVVAVDIKEDDSDGDICDNSDFADIDNDGTYDNNGKSDDYIDLTIQRDGNTEVMRIRCTKTKNGAPKQLRVWIRPLGSPSSENADLPKISSDKTDIRSFVVKRENMVTYPKVLKYETTIGRAWSGSVGPGEQLFLRGYINMRNEL